MIDGVSEKIRVLDRENDAVLIYSLCNLPQMQVAKKPSLMGGQAGHHLQEEQVSVAGVC